MQKSASERKKERKSVWKREWERVCERENERESVCVWERGGKRERESVCLCVCLRERRRERGFYEQFSETFFKIMQCICNICIGDEKSKSTIYEEKSIFTYVKITVKKEGKIFLLQIVVNLWGKPNDKTLLRIQNGTK